MGTFTFRRPDGDRGSACVNCIINYRKRAASVRRETDARIIKSAFCRRSLSLSLSLFCCCWSRSYVHAIVSCRCTLYKQSSVIFRRWNENAQHEERIASHRGRSHGKQDLIKIAGCSYSVAPTWRTGPCNCHAPLTEIQLETPRVYEKRKRGKAQEWGMKGDEVQRVVTL